MDGLTIGCMEASMDELKYGWMLALIDGWMDG